MPIQDKLSYTLDRKDQKPHKLLAFEIANDLGAAGIQELADFFDTSPHKELHKD